MSTAIHTEQLGKRYRLGLHKRGYGTLREAISEANASLALFLS